MASAVGMVCRVAWRVHLKDSKKNKNRIFNQRYSPRVSHVSSSYASGAVVDDLYRTLMIEPNASEPEYHPDVCRGNNCEVQFHLINKAYDIVMQNLRGEPNELKIDVYESYDADEPMRGMHEPDWDMWEEWMGWEGAGIRDYSSHVNPYI